MEWVIELSFFHKLTDRLSVYWLFFPKYFNTDEQLNYLTCIMDSMDQGGP